MAIIDLLQSSAPLFITFVIILGLLVGSFLNVVIFRLPIVMEREWLAQCDELKGNKPEIYQPFTLSTPRSRCPHCNHEITALENIPIISYLLLGGKCKQCENPISKRYPTIEALTGLFSGIIAWKFGFDWACVGALLLTWSLIALTFIDVDHQLLPDSITLPLLWLGITFNLFAIYTDLQSSVIGAIAGYLSLWLVFHAFRLATGKEGMGYGDFKLLAALGAWLGWMVLPSIILLSSLVGAAVGITLIILRQHQRDIPIPFGPYLAAAGWIALVWGQEINTAYLNWTGIS
ncbi:MAG: A24 family peptidase [Gammaproteobacteria bacterium]|nr:A24 family peptidase [Gammaproteobacteria bacterium]MDH5592072.1 A24 family peptidase [Gammaproteobacteria bacterium]